MAGKGGRLVFGNTHKGWRFSLMSSPTAKGALFFCAARNSARFTAFNPS